MCMDPKKLTEKLLKEFDITAKFYNPEKFEDLTTKLQKNKDDIS